MSGPSEVASMHATTRRSRVQEDTLALVKTGQDNETPLRIVETVVSVNDLPKARRGA